MDSSPQWITLVYLVVCYVHVLEQKWDKLDKKSKMGIFLGYSTTTKGYRIFSLKTEKIIIGRNVKFDELSKLNWNKKKVEASKKILNWGNISQEQDVTTEEEDSDMVDDAPVR